MRAAADKAGIRIHSVIYGGWDAPLSHPDPAVAGRGLQQARSALRSASSLGADNILLVPAVVNARTRYVDAYKRSQENVRTLIPAAQELKVMILIEEVWNNFLLSPLEFARYVDEFNSPWVQAYFDVGNVVRFAWPEDWIRTLGTRIKKVHIKDFKGGPGLGTSGAWVNLREGSINWPEVRRALAEIGYADYMTCELAGGDEAYLRDLSARFDKILAGE
jgi:hexulose-6-phosphate isomerase